MFAKLSLLLLLMIPATQPVALSKDSSTDVLLDAMHSVGKDMQSLAADVELISVDEDFGDESVKIGSITIARTPDGDSKALLTFTQKRSGNKIVDEKEVFLLDGPLLVRRNYQTKKQITDHIRKDGEKTDLFKLGQGPFPLPIGQPREEVLKEFDVTKIDESKNDLPNTTGLRLKTKPGSAFEKQFKQIDVWIDLTDHLPKKILTASAKGNETKTALLKSMRLNNAVKPEELILEKLPADWDTIDQGFEK